MFQPHVIVNCEHTLEVSFVMSISWAMFSRTRRMYCM